MSERGIQNYELGQRKPTYDILIKLADCLNCSVDWLVGRISRDYFLAIEEAEDEYFLSLALERKKNDTKVRISFEDILAKDGLTLNDLDDMEDVELEYELSS